MSQRNVGTYRVLGESLKFWGSGLIMGYSEIIHMERLIKKVLY
jgi:hypothetical protein